MAQAYPYEYKGKQRTKQDKCSAFISLDKARIWLDFNEFCAIDENKNPIYLFSQADIVNDSEGNDIELYEGMEVSHIFLYCYLQLSFLPILSTISHSDSVPESF